MNSFQTSGNSPGDRDRRCHVAILGLGTVGSAVAERLTGSDPVPALRLTHIYDRRARDKRSRQPDAISSLTWTDRFDDLLTSEVDIVVDTVSSSDPAADYVRGALLAGKSVVTANRQVIARHGLALQPSRRSRRSARSRRVHTVASPRRWRSCRRRTGSDSPARLPGEILGRPLKDLALGGELRSLDLELVHPGPEPGHFLLRRLGHTDSVW